MFSHFVWQPIFDRNGAISKVEALARSMDGGPPDIFHLENTGEISKYDTHVFSEALRFWHHFDLPAPQISLNISPNSFCAHDQVATELVDVAVARRIKPCCISIEVLETALFDGRCRNALRESVQILSHAGFSVILDDFGRRSASLDRLVDLDFSGIKLDGFFVQRLLSSRKNKAESIIRSIVKMSHELGMDVTAEYVETPDQLSFLFDAGVDNYQGFWLSPPLKTGSFLNLASLNPRYLMPDGEACRLANMPDARQLLYLKSNVFRSRSNSLRRIS